MTLLGRYDYLVGKVKWYELGISLVVMVPGHICHNKAKAANTYNQNNNIRGLLTG